MKYLLIAIYLLDTSIEPRIETRLVPDKTACQAEQTRYLESQRVGSKWAICKKLKNPVTLLGE